MNKKPFILLSSLFLLSGCATYNEITEPKQVREKMQQIEASQEGFSLKNVTLTSNIKIGNNKTSTEARTETIISIDNKYVSTTLYMKADNDGQVTEATTKAHSYIKDNYYYLATETTSKDQTQRIYAQSEIDPNKIDTIFDELELDIDEIEKSITGSDYLATFKASLLLDKIPEGMKFYTTGEGSLKISYEKETTDSKLITEVEFVNNFISSTYTKTEKTNKDGDISVTEASINISLSSNVTYPDLSTYTLVA